MEISKAQELSEQTGNKAIEAELESTHEQYEDTPIWVRGDEEVGYFATIGDRKITENYQHKVTLLKELEEKKWSILLNVLVTIVETMNTEQFREYKNTQG